MLSEPSEASVFTDFVEEGGASLDLVRGGVSVFLVFSLGHLEARNINHG